jgi:hypothetical protein
MRIIISSGLDRILAAVAAFATYILTPTGGGIGTWVGIITITGLVLWSVRTERRRSHLSANNEGRP